MAKRTIILAREVLINFRDKAPDFDIKSPVVSVGFKDSDRSNINIRNLDWYIKGTSFPVDITRSIFLKFKEYEESASIDDIAKKLSIDFKIYIPVSFLLRINTGSVHKLFSMEKSIRKKTKTREKYHLLTDDDIHLICKTIKDYNGDIDKVYRDLRITIPELRKKVLFDICYKRHHTKVSDLYFSDSSIIERGENDPALEDHPDLPGEIWKRIMDPDEKYLTYYVSNKGRIRNAFGKILKLNKTKTGSIVFQMEYRKGSKQHDGFSVPRVVAEHFSSINPSVVFNMSPKAFDIGFKDGDNQNISIENLIWVPKGSRLNNNGLTLSELNIISTFLENNNNQVTETLLEQIRNKINIPDLLIIKNTVSRIKNNRNYSYFTLGFEQQEWKSIDWIDVPTDTYFVSNKGNVRKGMKFLKPYKVPGDQRNRVNIEDYECFVDRLVCHAFIPTKYKFKDLTVVHLDGDDDNNCVENLNWVLSSRNDCKGIYAIKRKYAIKEIWKPIDWIPEIETSKYEISTLGRVRNTRKNTFIKPYVIRRNGYEYLAIAIRSDDGSKKLVRSLCRLVAQAFINPDIPNHVYGNIKFVDGDFRNCVVPNITILGKK